MITPIEELRQIDIFADLSEDKLRWLSEHGELLELQPGDILFSTGDAADYMYAFLSGEGQFRRDSDPSAPLVIARSGRVTGMLPFSRLRFFEGTGRAATYSRVSRFHKELFPEMLERIPELGPRLVSVMTDRVREVTRADQQRDQLAALGKISAGLAHELNNPAAAAKRSAGILRETLQRLRVAGKKLNTNALTVEQRQAITDLAGEAELTLDTGQKLTSLERSDREDLVMEWLEDYQLEDAWDLAPTLVDAGVQPDRLKQLAAVVGEESVGNAVRLVTTSLAAARLVLEIEQSTTRIFELVKAIKEYSYMDQAPLQEIDIHTGIESTLTIMGYKLRKNNIAVEREFAPNLPKVCAYGSELNQVWTNLIDNAADAMNGDSTGERKLHIRTLQEGICIRVEIADTGGGIPPDKVKRIFEPFFTTKGVGDGTGLGLDTVRRIVDKHQGSIRVESKPGDTRFVVLIPIRN